MAGNDIHEINVHARPFHVGVASRLATAIYVAMVTSIYMTIMTQISNMKVIGLMVDFLVVCGKKFLKNQP